MQEKLQASTRAALIAAAHLEPIQLLPQVPRPPHELLVLVLLHLQFLLPLHADRLPPARLIVPNLFVPEILPLLLPLPHPLQKLLTGHLNRRCR